MKIETKWIKVIYNLGIITVLLGAIDPLEGSIIIVAGSLLLAFATHQNRSPYRKRFIVSSLLIIFGVSFLWYLSSLGGFGGTSDLSWGWGLLIIPYPVGWILAIITIFKKKINRRKYKMH